MPYRATVPPDRTAALVGRPRTVAAVDLLADLPLARETLDRAADLRADPTVLTRAVADPATRVLLVGGGEVVVADEPRRAALLDPATARLVDGPSGWPDDEQWLLLGRDGEAADAPLVLARRVARGGPAPRTGQPSDVLVHRRSSDTGPVEPEAAPGLRWASLRDVGADLPARDAGLATMAVALDAWHTRHPRCPRCGAPTALTQGGWVRLCRADATEHYPRTDPAIIVAVVDDDDRVLLGHAAAWPDHRYSTLAGFVEAGESAEHAVRREVFEETAVVVDRVEYRGSQPWPFPASLMLAYRGHAATTEIAVDGVEVTAARWFSRDELAAAIRSGEVLLPMATSVAYALITDWFGAPLPPAP